MLADAARFEDEYAMEGLEPNVDEEAESMTEMLTWAVNMIEEQKRDAKFLVDYFDTAVDEVCSPSPSPSPIPTHPSLFFLNFLPSYSLKTGEGQSNQY